MMAVRCVTGVSVSVLTHSMASAAGVCVAHAHVSWTWEHSQPWLTVYSRYTYKMSSLMCAVLAPNARIYAANARQIKPVAGADSYHDTRGTIACRF